MQQTNNCLRALTLFLLVEHGHAKIQLFFIFVTDYVILLNFNLHFRRFLFLLCLCCVTLLSHCPSSFIFLNSENNLTDELPRKKHTIFMVKTHRKIVILLSLIFILFFLLRFTCHSHKNIFYKSFASLRHSRSSFTFISS